MDAKCSRIILSLPQIRMLGRNWKQSSGVHVVIGVRACVYRFETLSLEALAGW